MAVPIFPFQHRFFGRVQSGQIAPFVLVPGSKGRVRRFASYWDWAVQVAETHEFLIYTGELNGVTVSACSTGIGGTSIAIAVQELVALGAHTLIRVGVTGTLQETVAVGDLTIATAAIRRDRISDFYVPCEIPALASHEIVLALAAACQSRGYTFHIGVTATTGTFYCGEGRPGANNYTQSFMATIVDDFASSGVLDWDTETATLFSLAGCLGVRAGRINAVLDSPRSTQTDPQAEERAVQAALEAVEILADWDQRKAVMKQACLLPEPGKDRL
jgi:uridine phosphorylase